MRKGSMTAAVGLLLLSLGSTAQAVPESIPPGSKLVYNFNLIGYPKGQTYDGGCGDGHRIFVNREANNARIVVVNSTTGWEIRDCDATGDRQATLATSDAGILDVYVRILGKPTGTLFICANTLLDAPTDETLCLLGSIDLTRGKGKSSFSLAPATMFDASLEDILWTVDTNGAFRHAQFRVYQRP